MNYTYRGRRVTLHPQAAVERFRLVIAATIVGMFVSWLFLGLIMLVVKEDVWILISSIALIYPAYSIVHYYLDTTPR